MATALYERSGTRASAHPDPELRIKSLNSVPDPSVPDHRMQYLKSDVELGVRSIPFHTCSIPVPDQTVFRTHSPLWEPASVSHRSTPSGSSMRSRPSGSDSIGTCTQGTWF